MYAICFVLTPANVSNMVAVCICVVLTPDKYE
jgi:hypothetical protein